MFKKRKFLGLKETANIISIHNNSGKNMWSERVVSIPVRVSAAGDNLKNKECADAPAQTISSFPVSTPLTVGG